MRLRAFTWTTRENGNLFDVLRHTNSGNAPTIVQIRVTYQKAVAYINAKRIDQEKHNAKKGA